MKLSKLFSPKDFNSKKLGLFVTVIFLIVELVLKIKGITSENYLVRLTHMTLLVGLTMLVFNYELGTI